MLATGGSVRRLPGLDRGDGRVHAIRTVEDAARFRKALRPGLRVGIVGGGWPDLEIAAAARQIGCEVVLYARQDRRAALRGERQVPARGRIPFGRLHGIRQDRLPAAFRRIRPEIRSAA